MYTIDLSLLYEEKAKIKEIDIYLSKVNEKPIDGDDVVLTGQAPIWLYLKVAHAVHGRAKRLFYESPVTAKVLIFDHNPY